MATFLTLLGVLTVLAIGTTVTGRVLASVFDIHLLRRATPESLATSAFIGTGSWILLFGWFSYAGFSAAWCLLGVVCMLLLLVLAMIRQRRLSWVWVPIPLRVGVVLISAFLMTALISMLPLLVGNCFSPFNDTVIYISVAEWLQRHGFGSPCPADVHQPVNALVISFQEGFRIGAIFLLALLEALFPHFNALELFPPVMAWGVVLNLAGIFVLCRWSFRIMPSHAALAVVLTGATVNPLSYSAQSGFFSQVYGTAALSFALAIASRLSARVNWRLGGAILFGVAGATLVSVYSELSPVLTMACIAFLIQGLWCAKRAGRMVPFLGFAAGSLVVLAILGNIEHVRALRSLAVTTRLKVGWHLPWSDSSFWAFAMGAKPYELPLSWLLGAAAVLATGSFALGLGWIIRQRRCLPVAVALAVFGGLATYYHFLATDPWTGQIGHTWSQFKICKWAFPIVMAIQAKGLSTLVWRLPLHRLALTLFGLLCALLALPIHVNRAEGSCEMMQAMFDSKVPFVAIRELQKRVEHLKVNNICLFHEPQEWQPRCALVAYLFYPRPILHSLKKSESIVADRLESQSSCRSSVRSLCIVQSDMPVDAKDRLPGGLSLIDPDCVVVSKFNNSNGVERGDNGEWFSWIGTKPATLHVWAQRPGQAILTFATQPGPSLPETPWRRLRVRKPDGEVEELETDGTSELSVHLTVEEGQNAVQVHCPDQRSRERMPNGDARPLLVRISKLKVERPEPDVRQ